MFDKTAMDSEDISFLSSASKFCIFDKIRIGLIIKTNSGCYWYVNLYVGVCFEHQLIFFSQHVRLHFLSITFICSLSLSD